MCRPGCTIGFAIGTIHDAWLEHLVLLFRAQQLSDEDLIAFSRRFVNLDWAPVQETRPRFVEGHPEIYVVSNVIENGVPIGSLGAGGASWHTGVSYLSQPPKASMFYRLPRAATRTSATRAGPVSRSRKICNAVSRE